MKYRIVFLVCLLLVLSVTAFAQEKPALKPPVVDGIIGANEYARAHTFGAYTLSAVRSGDSVFFALSVKTKGWVAIGVGSGRMDGATMFLGNVVDGKPGFTEQAGRGRTHSDVAAGKRVVVKSAVMEKDGVTTLEVQCRAAGIAPAGVKEIQAILAHSDGDSFTGRHAGRTSVKVPIE